MNTDDYEGHTEDGPWEVRIDQALSAIFVNGQPLHNKSEKTKIANARLIAAAPELLAEVKRLRGKLESIQNNMAWTVQVWQDENYRMEQMCEIYADLAKGVEALYHGDEEE